MVKVLILAFLILLGLLRFLVNKQHAAKAGYILISTFIQTLPFAFGKVFYSFLDGKTVSTGQDLYMGAFGNHLRVEVEVIFFFLFILVGYQKFPKSAFSIRKNKMLYVFFVLCIISYLNPVNLLSLSFLPLLSFVLQMTILIKLICSNFQEEEIIKGFYDGLKYLVLLNALLTVCYPILGVEAAVTLFTGEGGLEWSGRRGLSAAVGIIGHPGAFALFSLMCYIFFLSCYLRSYKKRVSIRMGLLCLFIIIFTFSRTTYVSLILITSVLILISRTGKSIISIKNISLFIIFFGTALLVLYMSPLKDMFTGIEAQQQLDNRLNHYVLGLQIAEKAPIIGTGINAHILQMQNMTHFNIMASLLDLQFYLRSPIHNIHMIVFAETGLIGLIIWIVFFINRIHVYSKKANSSNISFSLLSLTFVGILIVYFAYGFLGWSPFRLDILGLPLFLGGILVTFNFKRKSNKFLLK